MNDIEARLAALGYRFQPPPPPRPYERVVLFGDTAYVSGHGPTDEHGVPVAIGRLGAELDVPEGYEAARRCAVNCLGSLQHALGDLDRIERVVQVLGFVATAPGFFDQTEVVHGCSELLRDMLGARGAHARSAVGVMALPKNVPVSVEMVVRVRP
jgi:enamine deaminase RidA (YjgF/YER057c/UK114 family)